jgi:hypothetical protein
MAYRGQPFVYDHSRRRTRRLLLWEDLKKEAFERLLQECGWPLEKTTSFTKSFRACFRNTRCMFYYDRSCGCSYEEGKAIWTVMVPEAMDRSLQK